MRYQKRRLLSGIGAFFALAAVSLSSSAQASDATLGNVGTLVSVNYGVMVFNQNGTRTAVPSCQGATIPTRWAIDTTTPAGQAMLSFLLTAYSTNKKVLIHGTGACLTSQNDTEAVAYFQTFDF